MKLLPFGRRAPAAALQRVQTDKTAAETRLADLRTQRGEALLDDDQDIAAIDRDIAATERSITVLVDRIEALRAEQRRQHIQSLERERAAAIAGLQVKLAAREKLAQEVEQALGVFAEKWNALLDSRASILDGWPAIFSGLRQGELQSNLHQEMAWLLYSSGRPSALRRCSIPAPNNHNLGVVGIEPQGVAGAIVGEHEALIQRLKKMPLLDDETEEAAA